MEKDTFITDVMFRKYKDGSIIALMPHEISDLRGNVNSYQHVGQHGGAHYNGVIAETKPAKESEYLDLKKELESIGYNLKIVKKQNRDKYLRDLSNNKLGNIK